VAFVDNAGNDIGASGCSALAEALPQLSALKQLKLYSNFQIIFFPPA
jgi:hypothetical protein